MSPVILGRAAMVATAAIGLTFGYCWWTSDERAIEARLEAIGRSLSVPPAEGDLGPIARLATLRQALAPDIHVSAPRSTVHGDARPPASIAGRDAVLALAGRWVPPPGGLTVEFTDVQVTVADDRTAADVVCAVVITSTDRTGQRTVDARALRVGFTKTDGTWMVAAVALDDTLRR